MYSSLGISAENSEGFWSLFWDQRMAQLQWKRTCWTCLWLQCLEREISSLPVLAKAPLVLGQVFPWHRRPGLPGCRQFLVIGWQCWGCSHPSSSLPLLDLPFPDWCLPEGLELQQQRAPVALESCTHVLLLTVLKQAEVMGGGVLPVI